jgi:hypothetical protein
VTLATTPAVSGEIARVIDFAETLPEAPPARALRAAEQIRKLGAQMKALVGAEPASGDLDDDANPKEKTARRQIAAVFDLLTAFYRDLLALRVGAAESVVNRDRIERMRRLAARGEPERWQECLDALLLARRRLMANANVNLVTEVLTMALLSRR